MVWVTVILMLVAAAAGFVVGFAAGQEDRKK